MPEAASAPAEELKTYHGNCHCGSFKFTLTVPEIRSASACSCSICSRKGYLWVIPTPAQFHIEQGEDSLTSYLFGPKNWAHKFCPTCGTGLMCVKLDGSMTCVNVNALRDFDTRAIEVNIMDGTQWGEPYKPADPILAPAIESEDLKTYTGQCHCGAVKFAFKSHDLADVQVVSDNCSICTRNAYILALPPRANVAVEGLENTTGYMMGRKISTHRFCTTCGVPLFVDASREVPEDVLNTLPESVKRDLRTIHLKLPINLRAVEGLDLEKLKITKMVSGQEGYVVA